MLLASPTGEAPRSMKMPRRATIGLSACAFVVALVQAATPAAAPLKGGYLEIVDQFVVLTAWASMTV